MAYPSIRRFTVLIAFLSTSSGVYGQFEAPVCVGKIDKFPNCEKAYSIIQQCSNLSKQETIDCFCTQELLNAYEGCKGEFRQCSLDKSFDSSWDDEIKNWYDACSAYLPSDITTPAVPEPTRTLDGDTCKTIIESCAQLSQSITSCSSAYSREAQITSCRCQEKLVSLASVCNQDGEELCFGTTVIKSNIWEFENCEAATDVFTSKTTGSGPITTAPAGTMGGNAPTKSLTFGPDATTTSSSGAADAYPMVGPITLIGVVLSVIFPFF